MTSAPLHLVAIQSHPVQYHAPVYRCVQQEFGITVTAVYGSDCSIAGYRDEEFGRQFAWDTDLLSGYSSHFLRRVSRSGEQTPPASAGSLSRRIRWLLQELAPTAVLLTAYHPWFYSQAFYAAARLRLPLLLRAETTDEAVPRGWLKRNLRTWLLRRFYRRFAKLLYIGQNSLRHYQRHGARDEQLVFSPYCVDAAAFATDEAAHAALRLETRRRLNLTEEQVVVVYSGKLVRRKDPELLIDAVRQLGPDERKRTVVMFVGDGELRASLAAQAARAPAVTVRFAGFQNQTQLSPYYHAADMLVLPSRTSETWGLVVNEALMHGLPVLVSDQVGCAPDLVLAGSTGEVFPSGSAAGLLAALKRVLPLCRRPQTREVCRRHIARYSVRSAAAGLTEGVRAILYSPPG